MRFASPIAVILLLLLAGVGYTAYAGNAVYHSLDSGRQELVAAQASFNAAGRSGHLAEFEASAAELSRAEQDFDNANQRSRNDPALRLVGGISVAGRQIDATAHLAAIGSDVSRAGEAAAIVAVQAAALKQRYGGHSLTADDLQTLLQQAQTVARNYSGSIEAIGQQLKAAHAERAALTTTDLLPQLQSAYDEVDWALADADTAFLRYQDVRQLLSDFLGVQLPS